MLTRVVWPGYAESGTAPVDAFWVECTEKEARLLLRPGEDLPQPGCLPGEQTQTYGFLVARDGRFCKPMPWVYPYSGLWNAYNPFRQLDTPVKLDSIAQLESISIPRPIEDDMDARDDSMDAPFAAAGSQRWLQVAVDRRPDLLLSALRDPLQLPADAEIVWYSPRAEDAFREYQDMEALRRLGIESLPQRSLADFWPQRGPVWDALGKSSDGQLIFVEAKAHIAEAASSGTGAGPDSRALIECSMAEARSYFASGATADWTGRFYQYANRLAHHYLFREVNGLPSHLVFLYFTNASEMKGPESELEWQGAIQRLHAALGLGREIRRPGVHDVFIDVAPLRSAAEPAVER